MSTDKRLKNEVGKLTQRKDTIPMALRLWIQSYHGLTDVQIDALDKSKVLEYTREYQMKRDLADMPTNKYKFSTATDDETWEDYYEREGYLDPWLDQWPDPPGNEDIDDWLDDESEW